MKWFEGNVVDAVSSARDKKCLFIVFVADEESDSTTMLECWDATAVNSAAGDCVALKILFGSESHSQFTQLYPVATMPTTYLINPLTGAPLEVIAGAVSAEDLSAKLGAAHQKLESPLSQMAAMTNAAVPAASSSLAAAAPPPAAASVAATPVAAASSASASASAATAASGLLTKEEKIAKAQELIAAKRRQRQEEERSKALDSEKERREAGKRMQDFKAQQAQRAVTDSAKEWRKEKQEAFKAREEIKRKIDEDKAARRIAKESAAAEGASTGAAPVQRASSLPSDTARIQFRLPDGSSMTEDFPSTSTLSVARQFVAMNVGSRWPGGFILQTTYPRQELTYEVDDQTLQELGLAPRTAVLVLPKTSRKSGSGGGGSGGSAVSSVSGLWQTLMIPLLLLQAIWQWLTGSGSSSTTQSSAAAAQAPLLSASSDQASPAGSGDAVRRRRPDSKPGSSFGVLQDGNVNRFKPNDGKDDDDMGTWNGNSTQQQ